MPIEDQAYQTEPKSRPGPSLLTSARRGAAGRMWGGGEGQVPSYLSKYTRVSIVGHICMPGPRQAGQGQAPLTEPSDGWNATVYHSSDPTSLIQDYHSSSSGVLSLCLPNTRSLPSSCPVGTGCGISTGL